MRYVETGLGIVDKVAFGMRVPTPDEGFAQVPSDDLSESVPRRARI